MTKIKKIQQKNSYIAEYYLAFLTNYIVKNF